MINQILVLGFFTIALSLLFLKHPFFTSNYRPSEQNLYLLTGFFAFFIFTAVFNCFNARSDRIALLSGILKNRAFTTIMLLISVIQIAFIYLGGSVLRTLPLTFNELKFALFSALLVFPADFIRKIFWKQVIKKPKY